MPTGCTVFAALTAQNPFGVSAIHGVPADFVAAQLDAVLGVYSIRALKTGMLADPAAMRAVCSRLLPLATLITPNLPEAEVLCGRAVDVLFDGRDVRTFFAKPRAKQGDIRDCVDGAPASGGQAE